MIRGTYHITFDLFDYNQDLDVPIHLLRNVCFFCDSNGLAVMRQCFEAATPDTLPFSLAHAIIAIVANVSSVDMGAGVVNEIN